MKYLVFIIYVMILAEFFDFKLRGKGNSIPRGQSFYKIRCILNFMVGFGGMICVNVFLRDKDIIPPFFVWTALVGFMIIICYALYCAYKMMVSLES